MRIQIDLKTDNAKFIHCAGSVEEWDTLKEIVDKILALKENLDDEEIAPIDSEKGIKQRDKRRAEMLKEAEAEEKKEKRITKTTERKYHVKPGKKFTPAVDRYIKDHAADMSNEDLATALKRVFKIDTTPGSVGNRKSIIGAETKKPGPKSKEKESDEKPVDALDEDIDELELD